MTVVALESIAAALERAGLLVGRKGVLPETVASITDDSRAVHAGSLFLAVRGSERDGHVYLPRALESGAVAAVVDDASRTTLPALVVSDTRRAAALAAAAFYGEPARALRLAAVTGTNGKTTTVGMLRHLLDEPDRPCASIGTLGVLIGSEGTPLDGGSGLTTPGPVELQRVLRALVDAGVHAVAMETSSHALHQRRLDGLVFEAGVFTNLTRDHLDYHVTMDAYLAAKALLVSLLDSNGAAVTNADDPAWNALPPAPRSISFGMVHGADVRAVDLRFSSRGSNWTLSAAGERHSVTLPLIGDFNVANALGAAAAAYAMGRSIEEIARRLSTLPQVPGRLEIIADSPTVLRDYAHTPDALERALDAVRPFTVGTLTVVVGCGGDRDRGKRPEMGRIAEARADRVIVTSDNPRTEDPERILDDIEAGMTAGRHERIEDRHAAIARAIQLSAGAGDVVLLAGKGHETYQIRGTVKYPFDERDIVRDIISAGRA
ncbi:MAG: UDP-N-acetylmuramoyl-L-alanyl-D-glutamate--2,6-diaminopimelate ligase [Gemmatimonadota bacterium]